jgi:PAS domain S-box-containing protein
MKELKTNFSVQFFDRITDAFIIFDKEWRYIYANREACKIVGKKKSELLGNVLWDLFPEAVDTEAGKNFLKAAKTKKPFFFKTYFRPFQKWFDVRIYPHNDGIMILFHDITSQNQAEEALQESESRFRATFYQTTVPMSLADAKGNWLLFNKAYTKMFGYSEKELRTMTPKDLIFPDDYKKSMELFLKLVKGKTQHLIQERRYLHKNGSLIYGIINGSVVRDKSGKPKYMSAIIEDITARKKIEESLKASEERFRTLIEQSTDVIQLISADGKVLYTSDSIKRVLGYTPQEILGKDGMAYLHPEDAPRFFEVFARLLEKEGTHVTLEYRLKHKNGSWVWVEATGTNHLADPAVQAIVGNFRDITQRKQLEKQKDEFLGIASHELKTPVTSIKAFAQILQNRFAKAGDKESALMLGKMDTQINKLTSLIKDLLDVSKVEGGRLKMQSSLFNLDELSKEIVEEVQRTTEMHTIIIKGKTGKTVYADRERIGQVLTNFLTNAVKYSPNNAKIIVSTSVNKDEIITCVTDAGVGIPKEHLPHVFDRFFRVSGESYDTVPGMGLGLNIASEIIKRHDGRIWAESIVGQGSKFYFTLPLKREAVT